MGAIAPSGAQQTVWPVVRAQHGVITRSQLAEFGFSDEAIRHRLERGRLRPVWPGVYAVGPLDLTRHGVWMAAVLACGDGAALSHESAAALWGIRKGGRDPIDVSTPATRHARLEAIQAHRRNPMPETTTVNSIPVTQPLFTLVDLAASLKTRPLEAAINEADKLGLVDPEDAPGVLDAIGRVAGKAKLRRALTRHTRTDSDLERRFLRLVERARLPKPQTQAEVNGYRVDFYWPEYKLVVETDGLTYHRTPTQQIRDRERDQAHTRAGLTNLRFANLQISDDPATVIAMLTAVSARLRNTPPRGGH